MSGSSLRRPSPRRALLSLSALLALALLAGCASKIGAAKSPDPTRIQAHTTGFVSRTSPIRVVLAARGGEAGSPLAVNPFRFDPPVRGAARWEDENTVSFVPESPLAAGQLYRVRFDSGLLRARSGSEPSSTTDYFTFDFRTLDQRLDLSFEPLRAARDGSLELSGTATLSDEVKAASVEKAVSASGPRAGASPLSFSWSHESGRVHRFTVKGIGRTEGASQLVLRWKGSPVGAPGSGSRTFRVPAKSSFELLDARSSGEGRVELSFSEPLDRRQDLRGIVGVDGVNDLRYEVEGGTLCLYAPSWPERARVRVEPSLKSSGGASLAVPASAEVLFTWEKPQVRYLSKGAILPTTQGLTVPIETMNLSGIIVEAVRVYGDNMLQFLQVNDLASSNEMGRVGEVVWRSRIDLGWKDDWKNRWVCQGLDLTPLLAKNKDGMFQIRITFRKDQTRYVCPVDHDFKDLESPEDFVFDANGDANIWKYVEKWPNGYSDFYKYREDPCHPAYYLPNYGHNISIQRNVLVSDIGAIARLETSGQWTVAASDLRSASPLAGVEVALFSYQRLALASGKTGPDGMVRLAPSKEPAFAVLSLGGQKSYLKIDSGSSLAVSHFDVSGDKADDGVKGFLYGERGVWRPGDDMHLTFVLYDRNKTIPAGDPLLFELSDPRGRVVRSGAYTASVNGFYSIETGTNSDAATGPYLAAVKIGGRRFTKSLRVETVMPNRLKIGLSWGDKPYLSPDTSSMRLESAWLTGAPVGALKADVSATFSAVDTAFPGYKEYRFDDPTREAPAGRTVLFDDELGPKGSVDFPLELSSKGLPPGKLRANLLTRVFEPSGVFSSESTQADFYPYSRYVGVKLPKGSGYMGALPTGSENKVELALLDRDGKPVKRGRLELALYRLEWRWWWESGEETLASIASELYERPIKKETVEVANGKASWSFTVGERSWGRYLVRAEDVSDGRSGGHAAGAISYIDWPYYSGGGRGDSGGTSTMLTLEADREKYEVGSTARITFPSNEGGRALVAVERAGRLLRQEWVKTGKDRTVYELPLGSEMAPNVYVHVTFVQPHLQTANDLPIRLYGVVPVMVEDPATRLSPLVEAPSEAPPNSDFSFGVREARGRPMTCTVAVVDEGLLGITKYSVPNPWNDFYRKEASSLKSFDLYDYVAGAYSGKLETLLAIGGSDEALAGGQRKQSRFPAVVYYFPPFEVKAGETVRKSFHLGPYVGALRLMVVAGSGNVAGPDPARSAAAFGSSETSVPIRAKLMAQLTAPRVLSPEEEVSIPATVFSFLGKKRVKASLSVSGAASLSGEAQRFLDFEADGDSAASFRIKASQVPGAVHLALRAEADGFSATQDLDLEVRALGVAVNEATSVALEPGKEWRETLDYPGAPGTNALSFEFSRLPSLDLGERLEWLIGYPHGCAEQTTSKAFPQLYLPGTVALSPDDLAEVKRNVAAAIDKLGDFQTPRGGFTLWPGQSEDEEWLSAYVTHFLAAAKRAGYAVEEASLDRALDYLERDARAWNSSYAWSKSVQAYRLYVLALAGRPELSSMNRFREYGPFPASAQYRLAAAYALAGQRQAADRLLGDAPTAIESYEGLDYYTYGSSFRERASVLDALNAMGDTARGLPLYKEIAERLNDGRWLSTQEIGAALSASLPYAAMANSGERPELRLGEGFAQPGSLRLEKASLKLAAKVGPGTKGTYSVRNLSSTPVFMKVVSSGVPASGGEKAVSKGLSLELNYYDMDDAAVDPNALPLGSDFMVEAVVRNLTDLSLDNLALSHKLPAGWEIVSYRKGEDLPKPNEDSEDREEEPEQTLRGASAPLYDYQDVRDDRVLTYFSLGAHKEKRISFYVNKTYDGRFYLPAVSVESMYDARFQAIEPGRWLSDPPRAMTIEEKRSQHNARP